MSSLIAKVFVVAWLLTFSNKVVSVDFCLGANGHHCLLLCFEVFPCLNYTLVFFHPWWISPVAFCLYCHDTFHLLAVISSHIVCLSLLPLSDRCQSCVPLFSQLFFSSSFWFSVWLVFSEAFTLCALVVVFQTDHWFWPVVRPLVLWVWSINHWLNLPALGIWFWLMNLTEERVYCCTIPGE